jgi:hypothetical protein
LFYKLYAYISLGVHSAFEDLGSEWLGVFPGQPDNGDFLGFCHGIAKVI